MCEGETTLGRKRLAYGKRGAELVGRDKSFGGEIKRRGEHEPI